MQRERAVTEMPMLLKPRNGFCMRSIIGPKFVESSQNKKSSPFLNGVTEDSSLYKNLGTILNNRAVQKLQLSKNIYGKICSPNPNW